MASLKKAVEAKCKDCTYDPKAGGSWREQVEACTVRSCALWEVRPISVATLTARRKVTSTGDIGLDLDALVDGLEDDDDETPVAEAVAVA